MSEARTKMLYDIRMYAEQNFDKQIVYLAGGGLVLTVGFIEKVIPNLDSAELTILLYSSWICFILALITNLISHQFTRKSVDHIIQGNEEKGNFWSKITSATNYLSVAFLSLAIISFIIFIIKNLIS